MLGTCVEARKPPKAPRGQHGVGQGLHGPGVSFGHCRFCCDLGRGTASLAVLCGLPRKEETGVEEVPSSCEGDCRDLPRSVHPDGGRSWPSRNITDKGQLSLKVKREPQPDLVRDFPCWHSRPHSLSLVCLLCNVA